MTDSRSLPTRRLGTAEAVAEAYRSGIDDGLLIAEEKAREDDVTPIGHQVTLGLIAERDRLLDIIARASRLAETERAGLTLHVLGEVREVAS